MNQLMAQSNQEQNKIRMYSPKEYWFIGIVLSLLPVFIMSLSNAKAVPDKRALKRAMCGLLTVWIIISLAVPAISVIDGWYTGSIAKEAYQSALSSPATAFNLMRGQNAVNDFIANLPEIQRQQTFHQMLSFGWFILNLVLVLIAVHFSRRYELPIFEEAKRQNRLQLNKPTPVIIGGIIFVFASYYLSYFLTQQTILAALKS